MPVKRLDVLREYIDEVLLNMTDVYERRCAYIHLYGVAQLAGFIASKRGEDTELAIMAGMLHDIYSYSMMDTEDHAHKGSGLAREILGSLYITDEEETGIICDAIRSHSEKGVRNTDFDEILKDADVLQQYLYDPAIEMIDPHRVARMEKIKAEFGVI